MKNLLKFLVLILAMASFYFLNLDLFWSVSKSTETIIFYSSQDTWSLI